MNRIKKLTAIFICLITVGCGGGDGESPSSTSGSAAILTVNKDGLFVTDGFSNSTNYTQASNSAYWVGTNYIIEWSGRNMGYQSDYLTPVSGILNSFTVTRRSPNELVYAMTNLNYDISKSQISLQSNIMPGNAFLDAAETKIYGGNNDDMTYFFVTTSEVDLGAGSDTLILSQRYNAYKFSRVIGSSTSINVARDDYATLVKNVEIFQFADESRTLSQILSSIP